jgi:uncharacterized protein (TIGR00255 family)
MIRSMTAYAAAERTTDEDPGRTVGIEIRTYNSRYLDLTLRLPPTWSALEDRLRRLVSESVTRGRVEVKLQVREPAAADVGLEVDTDRADACHAALSALRDRYGLPDPITLSLLTGFGGVIRPVETERDPEAIWPAVRETAAAALADLQAMRTREGEFLAADISARLATVEATVAAIEAGSEGLPAIYRDRLQARIEALTGGLIDIDPDRIAQEAAVLADRSDITEEITRTRSHIDQLRSLMAGTEPAGRKLNFLLQELNREFNTMGAKTGKAAVSHQVVTAKAELEKIREQIQNIE